jgi:hypothetical protein
MLSIKTTKAMALIATMAIPFNSLAQNAGGDVGHALMTMDGTAAGEAGISAATGWHTCDVIRTGAGWGNHYVALTCTSGPFTNKWHIMKNNQKDAMLATALSAITSGKKAQVHISAASSGYNVIGALYVVK